MGEMSIYERLFLLQIILGLVGMVGYLWHGIGWMEKLWDCMAYMIFAEMVVFLIIALVVM